MNTSLVKPVKKRQQVGEAPGKVAICTSRVNKIL